jgi:hypothetical protein
LSSVDIGGADSTATRGAASPADREASPISDYRAIGYRLTGYSVHFHYRYLPARRRRAGCHPGDAPPRARPEGRSIRSQWKEERGLRGRDRRELRAEVPDLSLIRVLHGGVNCGPWRSGTPAASTCTKNRHGHRGAHRGPDRTMYFRAFGHFAWILSRERPAYISGTIHIGVTSSTGYPWIHHSSQRCSDDGSNRFVICHNGSTRLCWAPWTAH